LVRIVLDTGTPHDDLLLKTRFTSTLLAQLVGFCTSKWTCQINHPVVEEKEMDITEEAEEVVVPKKKITILDTRMAIRPFKQCPEGLDAFVMACNRKKTGGSTPEMFGIHFK
jgi:hypothetical protein